MNLQPNDLASASPSVVRLLAFADPYSLLGCLPRLAAPVGCPWLLTVSTSNPPQSIATVPERTLSGHLALGFEIALVAHHDHGEIVLVLNAQDLLLESGDLLEALARRDRVNEQEALACAHVLLPHRGVLLLAGRIENVEQCDLIVNDALLAVRVCGREKRVKS